MPVKTHGTGWRRRRDCVFCNEKVGEWHADKAVLACRCVTYALGRSAWRRSQGALVLVLSQEVVFWVGPVVLAGGEGRSGIACCTYGVHQPVHAGCCVAAVEPVWVGGGERLCPFSV